MRKAAWVLVLLLLTGCTGKNAELERAMDLRTSLLVSDCSFDGEITADFGEELYTFGVHCQGDNQGDLGFSITSPDTIAGITGQIRREKGELTFHDAVLAFPLLADGRLSPVSAPWLLLKTLRGGYLTAAGMDGDLLRLTIRDSYAEDALQLDIWLDASDAPVRADICHDGRRVLTMNVSNFHMESQ